MDGERRMLQSALRDIQTRRSVLRQQWRGVLDVPAEVDEQIQALDDEEAETRQRLHGVEDSPAENLRAQIQRVVVEVSRIGVDQNSFRAERRQQDAIEAGEARSWKQFITIILTVLIIADVALVVVVAAMVVKVFTP